jgi:hypothetical protein
MNITVARRLATIAPTIKSANDSLSVDVETNVFRVRDILKWTATPEGRGALRQESDVKDKLYDLMVRLL